MQWNSDRFHKHQQETTNKTTWFSIDYLAKIYVNNTILRQTIKSEIKYYVYCALFPIGKHFISSSSYRTKWKYELGIIFRYVKWKKLLRYKGVHNRSWHIPDLKIWVCMDTCNIGKMTSDQSHNSNKMCDWNTLKLHFLVLSVFFLFRRLWSLASRFVHTWWMCIYKKWYLWHTTELM